MRFRPSATLKNEVLPEIVGALLAAPSVSGGICYVRSPRLCRPEPGVGEAMAQVGQQVLQVALDQLGGYGWRISASE